MARLDLSSLSVPDAQLVQHGLNKLGFYHGTFRGRPGPLTESAYEAYLESKEVDAADPGPAPGLQSIGDRLVDILVGEVGVREEPRNSNRGKRIEEYQASTWLDGTGWPWCAAFICWGLKKVGEEVSLPFDRPLTAGAWDFERWARDEKLNLMKPRKTIRKGDIVCFTFSHIGLAIEDERGGYVATVEGNTDASGSREGGGVYKKRRRTTLIRSHIRLA